MITHEPNPRYVAHPERYQRMKYQRCGKSGLKLPRLSLGLWQNFGAVDSLSNATAMIQRAFDLGITHFDLANIIYYVWRSAEPRNLRAKPALDVTVDGGVPGHQLAAKLDGILLGLDNFLGALCGIIYCAYFQGSQYSPIGDRRPGCALIIYADLVFCVRIIGY